MRAGPSLTREQFPYLLKNPCEVPAQLSRLKDPNIGQGLLVPVVIHLQLYLEVADVGTRGGTDELPGFQIRKILSLIYVLFLGRYGHAPVRASPAFPALRDLRSFSSFPNIMG